MKKKNNNNTSKSPVKNDLIKNLLTVILIFIFLASMFTFFDISQEKPKEISMSELAQQVDEEKVKEIIVKEDKIEITLNDEKESKETVLKGGISSLEEQFVTVYKLDQEKIKKANIITKGKTGTESFLENFGPTLLMFALWVFFCG